MTAKPKVIQLPGSSTIGRRYQACLRLFRFFLSKLPQTKLSNTSYHSFGLHEFSFLFLSHFLFFISLSSVDGHGSDGTDLDRTIVPRRFE